MITWKNKDVSICAWKFPDREKPALCIVEGNTVQVYGYFNSDDCAIFLCKHLKNF